MDVNDTENTENKVSDKSTESANSTAESTEASKNDSKASKPESCLGAFKKRYNEIRNKKASARRSAQLELFCFIAIIVFAGYFKASHYRGQETPLLYYYEDANVFKIEQGDFNDGVRWCVTICYRVGNDDKRKYLYYKRKPKYAVGDTLRLKIQTINPNNIEIEGSVKSK